MIKKLLITATLTLATSSAMAAAVCDGTSTVAGAGTAHAADGKFVVTTFTPKCSAAVQVNVDENTTSFWGGSVSFKGKNSFKANTAGGAVIPHQACAASSGCVESDAADATTAAAALGSGS